jgi:hypothetical protein
MDREAYAVAIARAHFLLTLDRALTGLTTILVLGLSLHRLSILWLAGHVELLVK